MRLSAKHYLSGLAVLALALPVCARTYATGLQLDHPATISGKQLGPGAYELKIANGQNQLSVVDADGITVAEVPCHWIQLPKKSSESDVVMVKRQIVQVDIDGLAQAVQVNGNGSDESVKVE
jgi:hypothetical protein